MMILCSHLSVLAAAFVLSPSTISMTPHGCFSTLVVGRSSTVVHANRQSPSLTFGANNFVRQRHSLILRSTAEEMDTTAATDDDILTTADTDANASSTNGETTIEDTVRSMKIADIKNELQSLGISTKTFLEKSEKRPICRPLK